jgi:predicted RNase H-like nuclease
MHRILKSRRAEIKQLRQERDLIKVEKADLYHKALDVNEQIAEIRSDLNKLYEKRREKTKEIEKTLVSRRDLSQQIKEKRQEINTRRATKKTMFDACRGKKTQIMEKDKLIMKAQDDIRGIKGSHKDL